jgi:flagellar biosynthesis/type III secretory pathway protein FliH
MEKQTKIFSNNSQNDIKPLVMIEFISENDGLTFTYEDIRNAEIKGHTNGFTEGNALGISQGEQNAKNEVDDFLKEIIVQINQSLKEIIALETTFLENFFPSVLRICFTVLHKAMPHFFASNGKHEMEKILQEVIESLIIEVPIQIKVSELVHEFMVKHLHDICEIYPESIAIVKDANLSEGACQIEWVGGGAQWNLNDRYLKIEAKLQEYLTLNAA